MTLNFISTAQCINNLQNYATAEARSWNPFTLFKKRKLKNHSLAAELAKLLSKAKCLDADFLTLANALDKFEDSKLQHNILCFLHSKLNHSQSSFIIKRENINQINTIFYRVLNKRYRPWWTLFLFEVPYYSSALRDNLKWFIGSLNTLFATRRDATKQHLINVYANEETVKHIINEYHSFLNSTNSNPAQELNTILDLTLKQTEDHTKKELLREIQKTITKELPFGQILISAVGLSSIITSYLSQKENVIKTRQQQAQEILYIISQIFLKTNTAYLVKSFIPGANELVDAVISVGVAESALNPLHTDRKIGNAVASLAGGALGCAVGTVVPGIGTYIGAYVGSVVSKIAATRFYQVLEAWQQAPRGNGSIIPLYPRSYFFSLIDNDKKNILEPLYKNYLETEGKSKIIGDELAKWLCIYTLVHRSCDKIVEYLEIINEEIGALKLEFSQLKNQHSKTSLFLYSKKPDNPARVMEYKIKLKQCLQPVHHPIIGMLNEYYSSPLKAVSIPVAQVTNLIVNDLPIGKTDVMPHGSLTFFHPKPTHQTSMMAGEHIIDKDLIASLYVSTVA